ncbi:hypothetical protein PPACK8108_LOCUS12177 [Phakopsora pachyrhizi]|uniref:Uncharacterized protein n=1 Tax=Phakopsora pachyrhizi TaxID=170000 RepID=A0AAV0B4J3_PHAPC|nr:hypothetical protein PPACK8108_LOCUS12177 [Phakopsora pachyrhizi]
MAQGFKAKKVSGSSKNNGNGSSSRSKSTTTLRKGARVIPPTKPTTILQKLRKDKVSKSVNHEIEKIVVSKSVGKLSIMKNLCTKDDLTSTTKDSKVIIKAKKKPMKNSHTLYTLEHLDFSLKEKAHTHWLTYKLITSSVFYQPVPFFSVFGSLSQSLVQNQNQNELHQKCLDYFVH